MSINLIDFSQPVLVLDDDDTHCRLDAPKVRFHDH